jgi:hypothetical protein
LVSKVLAVPELRAQYLANVRQIADESLDWSQLGPVVAQMRELIDAEVKADTRKLSSYEAFLAATASDPPRPDAAGQPRDERFRGPERPTMSLREFADKRRQFLLNDREVAEDRP